MGLISTEVEIGINGKNTLYWEEKGYFIPRVERDGKIIIPRGTKIKVKVEDLSNCSNAKVQIKCDNCGKTYKRKYWEYFNVKTKTDNLWYCIHCKMMICYSGENHHSWKKDKSEEERVQNRMYEEYYVFVRKVLSRDNYTCQCCGQYSGNIEVHHLDGYNWCIEKRTEITNGITLCKQCHKNFHDIYGKGNNTKAQYEQWVGYVIDNIIEYNDVLSLCSNKKVYCFEENKVYLSPTEIAKEWDVNISCVYDACNQRKNMKSLKGKHLIWNSVYESNTYEENMLYLKNLTCRPKIKGVSLICLNTLENFISGNDAARLIGENKYGSHIIRHCKDGIGFAYKHPKTNEKLYWLCYDEYQLYSNEKKQQLKDQYYTGSFLMQ